MIIRTLTLSRQTEEKGPDARHGVASPGVRAAQPRHPPRGGGEEGVTGLRGRSPHGSARQEARPAGKQRRALRGPCRRSAGLTLIELILTLSILAVAGVLVSGALATSLRAWQSGFAQGREELTARIVLERIAAQLRSAVASPAKHSEGDAIAFDANEHALHFVTCAAAGAAPVQVSYALEDSADGGRLVYREYPWPDKDFFGEHRPRRVETIPAVTGFTVSAVPRSEEESDDGTGETAVAGAPPQKEWTPLDQRLPKSVAVEISLQSSGGGEARVHRLTVALPGEVAP